MWFGSFTGSEQKELLNGQVKQQSDGDIYSEARRLAEECDAVDLIERMQSLDTQLYLAKTF